MKITSAQCWQQEALQLGRATSEPLENVRNVAMRAAKAWRAEGVLAEKREARSYRKIALAEAETIDMPNVADLDARISENPDCGFADQPDWPIVMPAGQLAN